jgi:hypothetical protein
MNTSEANAIDLTKPVQWTGIYPANGLPTLDDQCVAAFSDPEEALEWARDVYPYSYTLRCVPAPVNAPEPAAALESRVTKEMVLGAIDKAHAEANAKVERLSDDVKTLEFANHMHVQRHATLTAELADARAKAEAGEKYKAYTHQRLDEAGIETHPNGKHSKAGCRIGDRLDLLVAYKDAWEKLAGWLPKRKAYCIGSVAAIEISTIINHMDSLIAQPPASEAVKAERPARPPMMLAKNEREEWRWWLRTKGLHRNSWTTGCMNGAKGTIACESDAFDAIDRDASDPRAVELFDADLAASNEGSAT